MVTLTDMSIQAMERKAQMIEHQQVQGGASQTTLCDPNTQSFVKILSSHEFHSTHKQGNKNWV